LRVVLQHVRDVLLVGRWQDVAGLRLVRERDRRASMIAPAKARPNDSPKDPVAELTPAASPTLSSEMGDSV
jgi:hypothetical protein